MNLVSIKMNCSDRHHDFGDRDHGSGDREHDELHSGDRDHDSGDGHDCGDS